MHRFPRFALLAPLLLFFAAACGGGADRAHDAESAPAGVATTETKAEAPSSPQSLPGWVAARLAQKEGEDVELVLGTVDHGVGENRVLFLVARSDNEIVQAPRADVYYAREGSRKGAKAEATLVPIGPHSHPEGSGPHHHQDATDLYVTDLEFSAPGRYWLLVEPEGETIQAVAAVDVRRETVTPPVGSRAIPSETPTLADAPAEEISTATPPDTELLRYSIKESLDEGVPFVVVFATPRFCVSRTCGPVVEVVDKVRQRLDGNGVRFIHVEIFENNDPEQGYSRWVREWSLPSEPWVFLVGGDGVIRAKFEGSITVGELETAVRQHLL